MENLLAMVCCLQEFPERLMLTYKPEEESSLSEDTKVVADEPKPVPLDDGAVSTAEVAAPAPPPPPPTNNLDTDDLLVDLSLTFVSIELLMFFGYFV